MTESNFSINLYEFSCPGRYISLIIYLGMVAMVTSASLWHKIAPPINVVWDTVLQGDENEDNNM